MASKWYYSHEDREYGPFTPSELRQLAAAGKLLPGDLVGQRGRPNWVPAQRVRGLFPPMGIIQPAPAPDLEVRWQPGVTPPIPLAKEPLPPEPPADPLFGLELDSDDFLETEAAGLDQVAQVAQAPEPWFYRFLERYAKASIRGGVALGLLLGTLVLVWRLTAPKEEDLLRSLMGQLGGDLKALGLGDLGDVGDVGGRKALGGLRDKDDLGSKVMWWVWTVLLPIITTAVVMLFAFLQAAAILLVLDIGRSLRTARSRR